MQTYLWFVIHNPIEFDKQAGFPIFEAKIPVLNAWARSKISPWKSTGLSSAHFSLQISPVLVIFRLFWSDKDNKLTTQASS